MANVLSQHQHELLWPNGESALIFGTEDTEYLTLTPPQIDAAEGTVGDVDRPREDGRMFGEDFIGAKTLSFEIAVLTDRHGHDDVHAANLAAIDRFESVWRSSRFRNDSTKIAVLRSNQAGETWLCYGRPRSMGEATGTFTSKGYTPLTADFALADAAWYSDTLKVESATIPAPRSPGLIGPLKAPLTTGRITSVTGGVQVGGSRATWPVITINGPVTNPKVRLGNAVTVELAASLAHDVSVTIDPRPWARTVLRNDGASVAGDLTAATTMLRKMTLDPGAYEIRYEGIDMTGTSNVSVEWRDCRSRP